MARWNMWRRAGAVASVLWFVGAGLYQRMHDVDAAGDAMGAYYRLCLAANPNSIPAVCMDQAKGVFKNALIGSWSDSLVTAVLPIVLGWLLAFVAFHTVRWVLAGRRQA